LPRLLKLRHGEKRCRKKKKTVVVLDVSRIPILVRDGANTDQTEVDLELLCFDLTLKPPDNSFAMEGDSGLH